MPGTDALLIAAAMAAVFIVGLYLATKGESR